MGRYTAAAATAVLMLLTGCPAKTESTPLNVDASVPEATRQKITRVTSPMGSVDASAADTLPKLTTAGETWVLAGDDGDDVYLAAIATADDPRPLLSARSTALTLVRLAQGTRPPGVTGLRFNTVIQATAQFGALERLVAAALAAGMPPMRDAGVAESVLTTLTQAMQALNLAAPAALTPTASGDGRLQALALAATRVNGPLPYTVLQAGPLGATRLRVVDAAQAEQGVLLQNGMTVNFAARAIDANVDSSVLPTLPPDDDTPHVVLPSTSLISGVLEPDPRVAVAGIGTRWNLNIYRTPGVKTRDGIELAQDLWNMSLQGLGVVGEECVQKVVVTTYLQTPIAVWASKGRDEGFEAFRSSLTSAATFRSVADLSALCLRQKFASLSPEDQRKVRTFLADLEADSLTGLLTPFVRKHMGIVMRLLPWANRAETAYDVTSAASKALLMYWYWDFAKTVGVCQRRDAASGLLTVASCPTTLELDRPLLELATGAQYRYGVVARDHLGNSVPVPGDLRFRSSQPQLVAVDAATGVITVLGYSPALPVGITAEDSVTGASGSATVITQPAVVSPPVAPTETLNFQSGVWSVGSYFQGGATPADPVNGGFRFYRSGPLDDPFLSQSSGRYVSGMFMPTPANVASDNYFVAVERVDGRIFDALSLDVGLFDFASGSSFARPALEMVGTLPNGTVVTTTASLPSYFTYGAGSQLTTITLPDNFRGLQRLTVRMKLRSTVCDSCKVGLTLDNVVLR